MAQKLIKLVLMEQIYWMANKTVQWIAQRKRPHHKEEYLNFS